MKAIHSMKPVITAPPIVQAEDKKNGTEEKKIDDSVLRGPDHEEPAMMEKIQFLGLSIPLTP